MSEFSFVMTVALGFAANDMSLPPPRDIQVLCVFALTKIGSIIISHIINNISIKLYVATN